MIKEIDKRIENGMELTQSEFDAVKKLVKFCAPGYCVSKIQKRTAKVELGMSMDAPTNPLTGYMYGYETGGELATLVMSKGWCGQFAGKAQWATLGRKVSEGQDPCLTYQSIYKKPISLFAYEQTEND